MIRRAVLIAGVLAASPAAAQERVGAPIPALLDPTFLLSTARIVDPDAFRGDGAILGATREVSIAELSLTAADRVFVPQPLRGRLLAIGDLVQLYRFDRRINDPRTGERLGRLLLPTGIGRVDSLAGPTARLRVTHAFRPILIGDFARPVGETDTLLPLLVSRIATTGGYVVATEEEKAIVAPFDRLLLRLAPVGTLDPGDIVLVYRAGPVAAGRRLPDIPIGRAMLIRAEGDLAAAVLYEVYRSDLVPGDPFRPLSGPP